MTSLPSFPLHPISSSTHVKSHHTLYLTFYLPRFPSSVFSLSSLSTPSFHHWVPHLSHHLLIYTGLFLPIFDTDYGKSAEKRFLKRTVVVMLILNEDGEAKEVDSTLLCGSAKGEHGTLQVHEPNYVLIKSAAVTSSLSAHQSSRTRRSSRPTLSCQPAMSFLLLLQISAQLVCAQWTVRHRQAIFVEGMKATLNLFSSLHPV